MVDRLYGRTGVGEVGIQGAVEYMRRTRYGKMISMNDVHSISSYFVIHVPFKHYSIL